MTSHFDTSRFERLDREERIKELRPAQLLAQLGGVTAGMTCVDMGCGTGTFALPMADCVGSQGTVYAVDDSAEMLEHLRAKGLPPNLRLLQRDAADTGLPGGIADFCLLAFILHEVDGPARLLREAYRLLKPGGRALVVEWKAELNSPGPPQSRRLTKQRVNSLFDGASFSGFEYTEWSRNHYAASARKDTRLS